MSSQRGNVQRTRAQKYKNRHVFKNDLHDKTPQQQKLNALHVSSVCQRCKDVIEWKIKYKKYKPLSQAKTCVRCHQRNVRKAYHVICHECSFKDRVCAKCLKSADEVAIEEPQPTPQEQQQLQAEMDRLIKSFSERKRRAFLRYMKKGKKTQEDDDADGDGEDGDDDGDEQNKNQTEGEEEAESRVPKRIPHTREELLEKIKQMTLNENDEDEDDWELSSDSASDNEDTDDNDDDDDEDSDDEKQKHKGADSKK